MSKKWTEEELNKLKSLRHEGKDYLEIWTQFVKDGSTRSLNAVKSMLRDIEHSENRSELKEVKERLKKTQRLLAICQVDKRGYQDSNARKLGEIENLIKENESLQKINKKIAYKARLIAIGAVIYVLFSAIYITGFLHVDSKQSEVWGRQ